MKKKVLTRIVPCTRKEFLKVQRQVKDALNLASVHDPDLVKAIKELDSRIDRLVRHVNREIGVAQKIPLHSRIDRVI